MYGGTRLIALLIGTIFLSLMFMPARLFFPIVGAGAIGLGFLILDGHPTGGMIVIATGVVMIGLGIWINIRGDADDNKTAY
ncbi:MAG: hypothetical protein IPK83_14620 [Planctomycetes bacterium]|nr:hypothetical protein [Planctomycetota bacterium]